MTTETNESGGEKQMAFAWLILFSAMAMGSLLLKYPGIMQNIRIFVGNNITGF